MKVLVTGGAGFIGSHITRLLLDQGHTVLVYDNFKHSDPKAVDKRALVVQGDLGDRPLLQKTLINIEAVIHMAALIEVSESVKDPISFAENNILGTINLLEAMKENNVKKIIFSSSATVYGVPKKLPITEDAEVLAVNPYGATKVASENFLAGYFFVHGFDVTILRYFNPYGPGENHQPETHAIPNMIKAALEDRPIPLYWKGQQIRDFIYVEDLASAHIAVLPLKGWNVFNVGTEKGVRIIDVVNELSDIFGHSLKIEDLGERPGDVPANFASSKALNKATDWKAKKGLREGLEETVKWFRERK